MTRRRRTITDLVILVAVLAFLAVAFVLRLAHGQSLPFPGPGNSHAAGGGGVDLPTTTFGANLKGWYKADGAGNVCTGGCTNGNAITTLADQSGNSNNLTCVNVTYNTSQVNGLPGITAVAANSPQCTFGTDMNMTGASSIFATWKVTSTASKSILLGGPAASFAYWSSDSGGQQQGADNIDNAVLGTGAAAANTNWHQSSVTYSSPNISFRLNRSTDGSSAGGIAITATNSWLFRSFGGGTTEWMTGILQEIFFVNVVASGPQITAAEAYLSSRTGL